MTLDVGALYKKSTDLCTNELKQFTRHLRQSLLDAGVDQRVVDGAIRKTLQARNAPDHFAKGCLRIINKHSPTTNRMNRGIDTIGRLIIQYCFFRAPEHKMIWPEYSQKDQRAREVFVKDIMPRPLMRYFLVTVRGTIPELNSFETSSMLFGEENQTQEERKEFVNELINEFHEGEDSNAKDKWEMIYEDDRFKRIALDLISDIRRKIEQFGHDRYLRIIENLRKRDPDKIDINAMHRVFTIDDVRQIDESLWAAEDYLAHSLNQR